ncbi:MAG: rhodanese-related sulfurtransferase [Bdellovibrionales bacterium]
MTNKYYVTNFYRFTPVGSPELAKLELLDLGASLNLNGLIILATEGLNGTLATRSEADRAQAKSWLADRFNLKPEEFKDSESFKRPFRHDLQVRLRPEIVTLQRPDLVPQSRDESYLSPEQWHEWLQNDRSQFTLLDTRNEYEYKIGAFRGALNPKIGQFTEFPDVAEHALKVDKSKPVLIYCTGGIRCEKAALELKKRGYEKVYQLHGGILRYLEKFPNREFEGECFVFDDRVAVDQQLNATTRYILCPHCGDPADQKISCAECGQSQIICLACKEQPSVNQACSKNCAHHLRLKPWKKLSALQTVEPFSNPTK